MTQRQCDARLASADKMVYLLEPASRVDASGWCSKFAAQLAIGSACMERPVLQAIAWRGA